MDMLQLPLAVLCLFGSTGVLQSQCLREAQLNVPGLAVRKCLEPISQDKALGHEGELFKGRKGNLTRLEFHALENLSSHSTFCLTGKLRLKFLLFFK